MSGTNSAPGRIARESNEAPSTVVSGPESEPPTAAATCDASNLTVRNGTVAVVSGDRIHLVVLFGGQSAEHDVSCTTAAHVLAAADPSRYRITPVGISTDGEWALATDAIAALERGPRMRTASSVSPDAPPCVPPQQPDHKEPSL